MNNDVLIPRSILKRNNPGNLVKDKRLEEATQDYYRYQEDILVGHQRMMQRQDSDSEMIGKYDALFGRHLKTNNPLLSPKMKEILKS